MPGTYTYPGVYVEELPSGVRTIAGVSTSNTAFVDYFARGPLNQATRVTSFGDFQRKFGGLDTLSEGSYAIQQFYRNGGSVTWVVRVASGSPAPARMNLQGSSPVVDVLTVSAVNEGEWGDNIQVAVISTDQADTFNLVVREVEEVNGQLQAVSEETYFNLSMDTGVARYAVDVVNVASELVRLSDIGLGQLPAAREATATGGVPDDAWRDLSGGANGGVPDSGALIGNQANKTGIYALDAIAPDIFNIMCLPTAARLDSSNLSAVISEATAFCEAKRAFLIVDIPDTVDSEEEMRTWMNDNGTLRHKNASVYFPRLRVPDLLNEGRPRNVGASGTMAGVYARTDATRGVWKAPAGVEAVLRGANLATKITDLENGALNPQGINALRSFPIYGNTGWGARTLDGADQKASEWKYIPVRRTALYIEESLYQALKWVVFEPNDEPLWAQIRLNVGAFMHNLFRQGAFQGTTPRDAYLVKCDSETTTQNDIDRGVVNILVGFAPLKPAEFVVIKIQQLAGQIET
jgi:phage tail sheath protein FI